LSIIISDRRCEYVCSNTEFGTVSITPTLTKEDPAMKRRDFLKKAGVGAAAGVLPWQSMRRR
jgi:hypothetical protein